MSQFRVARADRELVIDMWGDRTKRNWRGFWLDPFEQADRSRIAALAEQTAAAGVWICPTLTVLRYLAADSTEFQRLRSDPTIRYVPPQIRSEWEARARFLTSDEGNDPAIMRRGFETALLSVEALRDAGARLLAGTDVPNPWVRPGFAIHEELALLVEAGLTPYEAIKAATHDPAEFLEALDEFGIIAVGRRADLILVDGNPLDDVAYAAESVGVMARGQWYTRADLQERLGALARKYARPEDRH